MVVLIFDTSVVLMVDPKPLIVTWVVFSVAEERLAVVGVGLVDGCGLLITPTFPEEEVEEEGKGLLFPLNDDDDELLLLLLLLWE